MEPNSSRNVLQPRVYYTKKMSSCYLCLWRSYIVLIVFKCSNSLEIKFRNFTRFFFSILYTLQNYKLKLICILKSYPYEFSSQKTHFNYFFGNLSQYPQLMRSSLCTYFFKRKRKTKRQSPIQHSQFGNQYIKQIFVKMKTNFYYYYKHKNEPDMI